ncbi:MAG: flagellar basal-body rod protein FlgG [bacterium]|nr:flagellar basal-body rod protein FlgG [bacterium]
MIRALYTSATGMKAQELMIDNTANNLANVNTNGFKRSQIDFADLIYLTMQQAGSEVASGQVSPTGLQIGSGVRPVGTTKLFTPGTPTQTGNPLDVMIEGDGFFRVTLPSGEARFTRDGALRIDANGQLVTGDGLLIDPSISIPSDVAPSSVTVGSDGTITGRSSGDPNALTNIGQLQLSTFPNPAGLSSEGGNLFAATPASGTEIQGAPGTNGMGFTRGSFLESSNVEVVTELISLISAQRAYEVNSRAIRAGDEMLSTTNDIVR